MPILCPLVQPNKAIGLESHIGSWLARCLEPTLLLAKLHEPTASNHHRKHETDEIYPQPAGSRSVWDIGLDARQTASPYGEQGGVFSLDILSHRKTHTISSMSLTIRST